MLSLENNRNTYQLRENQNSNTQHNHFRCNRCAEFTASIEPIMLRRTAYDMFHVRAICDKCKTLKGKYLNQTQLGQLPRYFFSIDFNFNYLKYLILPDKTVVELFPVLSPLLNGASAV